MRTAQRALLEDVSRRTQNASTFVICVHKKTDTFMALNLAGEYFSPAKFYKNSNNYNTAADDKAAVFFRLGS